MRITLGRGEVMMARLGGGGRDGDGQGQPPVKNESGKAPENPARELTDDVMNTGHAVSSLYDLDKGQRIGGLSAGHERTVSVE
jgi:hypothetical protein